MRDNPILPHSSLSDGIDKIKTAKTGELAIKSLRNDEIAGTTLCVPAGQPVHNSGSERKRPQPSPASRSLDNCWRLAKLSRKLVLVVSDHPLTGRIVAELTLARSMLERVIPPGSKLFPAVRALRRTQQRLDRPLRLAICGESNSGKSSLANLLGRIESLPTAAISNTRIPTLIYYAHEPQIWVVHGAPDQRARVHANPKALPRSIFRLEVGLPSPQLRSVEILDCPGLAGPEQIDLAPHAVDAALWCTVSIQAWKESERVAWSQLPARLRSCGLLVATHADLLFDDLDRDKLLTRLRQECGSMFRGIILVATVDALALAHDGESSQVRDAWHATGADMLETALSALMDHARDQRANSALRVTGRIAHHALSSIG